MAEGDNGNGAQTTAVGEGQAIQVGVLAQYIKDLSFENPNAPLTQQKLGDGAPKIDVNINVSARQLGDEQYEVDLKITARATQGDTVAFVVELLYSGIFGARNLPKEALQPFLLIEAPRIIFPFARRIIADVTRDGGFPPLLLEPIDFAALYRSKLQESQQGTPAQPQTVN